MKISSKQLQKLITEAMEWHNCEYNDSIRELILCLEGIE